MDFIKFTFTKKENIDNSVEEQEEFINDYLGTLFSNGQIHYDYSLVKKESIYFVFATLIASDSLSEEFDNIYVKERKKKIKTIFDVKIEVLGKNVYSDNICCCENKSGYLLFSCSTHYSSPIRCIDCWEFIPLYKFPYAPQQEEYYHELNWERTYKDIDELWYQGLADRWTERQMINPKSALSKIGRKICKDFENATNKPFYYFLFDVDYNDKYRLHEKCPECGEAWRVVQVGGNTEKRELYFCDKCRLISRKYWKE